MKVEQIPADLNLPSSKHIRSEGVHVSSVIRCIATESGILKPEYAEALSLVERRRDAWWVGLSPSVRLKMAMGLAWEEWYLPQLEGVIDHPGEMELDGIYMTHDGESVDFIYNSHTILCHEVKLTYKSTNTVQELQKEWMWQSQTKAYCRGLDTRFCDMHILFACGDYSYPITPLLRRYRIEYTQQEVDDNWELITSYVHHHQHLLLDEQPEG